MDLIKKTKGRKPSQVLNDDDLVKQQKRHQYYLNFKSKHPLYYKKANAVGRPKKETSIPTNNNIIDEIILKLQQLKRG
jgi:hypothetical protein